MGKLNCVYLKKTEFDHKTLSNKIQGSDIVKICGELKINRVTGHQYMSTNKLYAGIKVPKLFIDKALKLIEKRSKEHEDAILDTANSIKKITK